MKIYSVSLALLLAFSSFSSSAQENKKTEEFVLKEDRPKTGSIIKRAAVQSSAIPVNKAYHELSTAQKNIIKSRYENMAENDEPPYPIDGTAPGYKAVHQAIQKIRVSHGHLSLLVDVNSDGVAENVHIMETPDEKLGEFAAKVMLLQKFKPAVCGGEPCKMQYPFDLLIRLK